jgi:hypothetical protein
MLCKHCEIYRRFGHIELTPTNAPFRMDVGWAWNVFLMAPYPLDK